MLTIKKNATGHIIAAGDDADWQRLGKRLYQRREDLGVSAHEVAKASGLSFEAVRNLENGRTTTGAARLRTLVGLCMALHLNPQQFLWFSWSLDDNADLVFQELHQDVQERLVMRARTTVRMAPEPTPPRVEVSHGKVVSHGKDVIFCHPRDKDFLSRVLAHRDEVEALIDALEA